MSLATQIAAHLKSGKTITALEAIGVYGSYRLAAVINVLRNAGMDITTELRQDRKGKRYGVYSLNKQ
jgi:hypothetical protein